MTRTAFLVVAGLVVSLRDRNLDVRIAADLERAIAEVDGLRIVAQRRVQADEALVTLEPSSTRACRAN